MNTSLKGKTAVVCGSTQGIGKSIAIEFASQGAVCILLARNEQALQETVQQLPTPGQQQHLYRVADFSKPDMVKEVIQEICKELTVHILLNNTGGPPSGPILQATEQDFLVAFNQHLICNHILTQSVVPCMRSAGYGRIINVISTSVKIPLKNLGVSNTIRGAVASWAKTMSFELAGFNITVNNILPGYTETARLESLVDLTAEKKGISPGDVRNEMIMQIPAGRFAQPEETAAVAAFLASPSASYVNGVSIPVDGGSTGTI